MSSISHMYNENYYGLPFVPHLIILRLFVVCLLPQCVILPQSISCLKRSVLNLCHIQMCLTDQYSYRDARHVI
jgi:hypothetical protein